MVITSQISKRFSSLRWTTVTIFLFVIGFALIAIQFSVMAIVKDFLVKQRVAEQTKSVNELSLSLVEYTDILDSENIYDTMLDWGRKMNGRALYLDGNGVVQIDTFSKMEGQRLEHEEVKAIRDGSKENTYGLHELEITSNGKKEKVWCVYYTTPIVSQTETKGILFVSLSIQDVMDMTSEISQRIQIISAVLLVITLLLCMVFTAVITRPIADMTSTVQSISKGDFSGRVKVRGSSELVQLGNTLNMMSERLDNLDKSRNEFLANASHELKTPLTSMKILIESLLAGGEDTPPELYKEFLTDINNEIDRLAAIVKDLLTIVQVDTNVLNLNKQEFEFNELVDKVFHNLEVWAGKKSVALTKEIPDEFVINADEMKLTQVIFNLVDNAIKYSSEDTQVTVRASRRGRTVTIQVADTGIGIPEEDVPHIFDRFYRVDKARSRATGGTGLGLSIVKSVVNMHQGNVSIESVEGVGTVFTIELPA